MDYKLLQHYGEKDSEKSQAIQELIGEQGRQVEGTFNANKFNNLNDLFKAVE